MFDDLIAYHIHEIAKREGFVEYKFETKAGSNDGDNFLGIMTAITLRGTKIGQITIEELHLLCKTPQAIGKNRLFRREIYVYSKLLPAFVEFQRDHGLSDTDRFLLFPKVYACEANETNGTYILIMQDLRAEHFKMWPREDTLPLDHQLFILRELGKLHGISFAMKAQRPQQFDQFKCLRDESFEDDLRLKAGTFIKMEIERAVNALNDVRHKRMMERFQCTYPKMVHEYILGEMSDEFAVITHSDCWCNNFLFQYDANDAAKLTSICILDWQITRYCPPVLDVLYMIFSSTDKSFRDQHYHTLISTYYSSLSDTIRKLGSDPDQLYTFDQFQMQLRKFGDFTLLCAPIIISLRLAKTKVGSNQSDGTEDEPAAHITNEYNEQSQMEYNRMINELVDDLASYGYIQIE